MTFHVISKYTGAQQKRASSPDKGSSGPASAQLTPDDFFTALERWQAERSRTRRLKKLPGTVIDLAEARRLREGARGPEV